jgi:hypothetical protein
MYKNSFNIVINRIVWHVTLCMLSSFSSCWIHTLQFQTFAFVGLIPGHARNVVMAREPLLVIHHVVLARSLTLKVSCIMQDWLIKDLVWNIFVISYAFVFI